jgi:hypothetical protein
MADAKISDLSAGATLAGTEVAPFVQSGATVKTTANQIRSHVLTTPVTLVGNATAGSEIRFVEDTDNGSNYISLKAPDNIGSNLTFTLPSADGTNGQVLSTNGSGVLSFIDGGGSIAPLVVGTNLVEQRNAANAQTFRVYNTYTDGSNYERGFARWSSNEFQIGTEGAGTGESRNLAIMRGASAYFMTLAGIGGEARMRVWNPGNSATVDLWPDKDASARITSTNTVISLYPGETAFHNFRSDGSYEMTEVTDAAAPSTNSARIYVRDNGSGKTQYVVRFATGAVQVLATEP